MSKHYPIEQRERAVKIFGRHEQKVVDQLARCVAPEEGARGVLCADGHYGYYFRLLYSQGAAASGRARDYVANGRMIGGFGVIAWPVRYGDTGVMTFIVNQDGVVYQQDLGPQTAEKAGVIASFNPDKGWVKADMTPP